MQQADAHIFRQGEGWAAKNSVLTFNAMSAFDADPRGPAVLISNDEVNPVEPNGYTV